MKNIILALGFLLFSIPAFAQTPPLRPGDQVRIAADATTPVSTRGIKFYFDSTAVADVKSDQFVGVTATTPTVLSLTAGIHVIKASAYGDSGIEAFTPDLVITVTTTPDPTAPSGIRLFVLMPDGTVRIIPLPLVIP